MRRGELSRAQVVAAALACIDRVGVEGFSVREVARDLGVFPTALYWHVPGGRNALLAAAAGEALRGTVPEPPVRPEDWHGWVGDLLRRYRQAVRAHPNVAPLLGSQLVSNAGVDLEMVEAILSVLSGAGFRKERLGEAYNATVALMLGFTTLELAALPNEDRAAWQESLRGRLPTSRYPVLAAHWPMLANRAFIVRWQNGSEVALDASFEAYVTAALAGLDALPRG